MNRFDYVKYDEKATETQAHFKNIFMTLEAYVDSAIQAGRAKSLVMIKLEEAYMWVGKAIRDEQVARNKSTELQEQRDNS